MPLVGEAWQNYFRIADNADMTAATLDFPAYAVSGWMR